MAAPEDYISPHTERIYKNKTLLHRKQYEQHV